jgi:hypothetical protein
MKPSTLSKRWKTSLPNRVWPYRAAKKLQKQIVSLQDFAAKGFNVRVELDQLTAIRRATLDPAVIVINDKLEDSIRSYASEAESNSTPSSPSPPTSTSISSSPPALIIPNLPAGMPYAQGSFQSSTPPGIPAPLYNSSIYTSYTSPHHSSCSP